MPAVVAVMLLQLMLPATVSSPCISAASLYRSTISLAAMLIKACCKMMKQLQKEDEGETRIKKEHSC